MKDTAQQIDGAFLAMMQNHRQGATLSDLSEAMRKISAAVAEAGRAGSFSLKITVKPTSGGAFAILDEVKINPPKEEPRGSIFFWNPETGQLLRDNPQQLTMPLKTIAGTAPEETVPLRQVANG